MLPRGPSQTVLRCERGLVYTLGPDSDGPRVDTISLDGGVKMRHVAGREMVNLEQMLPQVARDPAQLARLTSRNTYLEADQVTGSLIGAAAGGGAAGATGAGLQMQRLNATGRVFLSDQLRDSIRSLEAARVEFDRVESLIRVFGDSTADARIFNQDRRSGQLDTPFVGPEASIDLKTNAVRAGRFSGQVSGEK